MQEDTAELERLLFQSQGTDEQELGGIAKVPLRSHANENSFFGAEGLNAGEAQGISLYIEYMCINLVAALGIKEGELVHEDKGTLLHHEIMHSDFHQYSPCEYTSSVLDKENYIFSVNVDLDYPMLVSSLHPDKHHQREVLTPIMEESSYKDSHMHDDTFLVPSSNLFLLDDQCATMMSQESVISLYSSTSTSVSDLNSESSVYEVPVKRRRSITFKAAKLPVYTFHEDSHAKAEGKVTHKAPRWEGDLYTPRLQRGKGDSKEGYCSLCTPGIWLRIKQSSYWYHMNYHHGINASTGSSYDPPTDFQVERIPCSGEEGEGSSVLLRVNGVCGVCGTEVAISSKYLGEEEMGVEEARLDELIDLQSLNLMSWYKHAQRCHKTKP